MPEHHPGAAAPCPVIRLGDVVLGELTPHKVTLVRHGSQDHCRWVFQGPIPDVPGNFYYKIWNPGYVRRDNLPAAILAGFYDESVVPGLHALIFHDGLCRGYVMREGRTGDAESFAGCRDPLYARTRATGWFFVQFAACHTMICDGRCSLLDLEAAYPLRDLPRLREMNCAFEDPEYLRFTCELYRSLPAGARMLTGWPASRTTAAFPACVTPRLIARPHPVVRRLFVGPVRAVGRKVRNLVPRTDLIEGIG